MMTAVGKTGYLLGKLNTLLQLHLLMMGPHLVQRDPEFIITLSIQIFHFRVSSCCMVGGLFSLAASYPFISFGGIFFCADGDGYSDLGEPSRFPKVLQGQEIVGLKTPYDGNDVMKTQISEVRNHRLSEIRRCIADAGSCMLAGSEHGVGIPVGNSDFPCHGFGESARFRNVLQGQEIVSSSLACQGAPSDARIECGGLRVFSQMSSVPVPLQEFNNLGYTSTMSSVQVSSPSSVLMVQQASSPLPCCNLVYGINIPGKGEGSNLSDLFGRGKQALSPSPTCCPGYDYTKEHYGVDHTQRSILHSSQKSCRLFGFPLTKVNPVANGADSTPMVSTSFMNFEPSFSPLKPQMPDKLAGSSCTKVYKRGSVVGWSVDLSELGGYEDLMCELE